MTNKPKVLIVDDERSFTDMVKLNLEGSGRYQVIVENDSKAAINAIIKCQPDIILMDVIMPSPEGPDLVFRIRKHPDIPDIPIIFLTATIRPDEATKLGGGIGGHVFLAKPTSVNDLMVAIDNQLEAIS